MPCPHDQCNQNDCPIKQNPNDPLHWVCVKCKTEYSFRRAEFGFLSQFFVTFIISVLILLWLSDRPLPEQQQDLLPAESPTRNA